MIELFTDPCVETARHGLIPALLRNIFREIILSRSVCIWLIMRIAVVFLVAKVVNELGGSVAQMERNLARAGPRYRPLRSRG